jgi:hypothetical protein
VNVPALLCHLNTDGNICEKQLEGYGASLLWNILIACCRPPPPPCWLLLSQQQIVPVLWSSATVTPQHLTVCTV